MKNFAKNLCVWATALFAAGMMTSCKEDAPVVNPEPAFPEVTLNNQLWYNNNTIDLKSAAYTFENETYTFYLSPTEGLSTIQEVLAADDYIIVKSNNPKGEQTAEDYSSIVYGNIVVASTSISYGVNEYKVNVNFLEDGTLTVSAAVAMDSEDMLMVEFEGACVEALFLPVLENQCQTGELVKELGSIVAENNLSTERTTYYVYKETGVTAVSPAKTPIITLVSAFGADLTSVNLAEAQNLTLTVNGATPATGTLSVEILADKLGNVEGVKVVLEAKDAAEKFIRANYEGDFTSITKSEKENNLTAVILGQTLTAPLAKVFIQPGTGNYKVVCGTNAKATTPEELMVEGHYAAELTISADKIKEGLFTTVDLANTAECGFKVYDYTNYGMWDNSRQYEVSADDVKSGTARIAKVGDKIFWDLDAELGANEQTPRAMTISSDWFGVATPATIPDMTPVAPVVNMFQILDGESIYNGYYRDITGVQVGKVKAKQSGTLNEMDYYYFFFMNADSETNGVDGTGATPRLRLRTDYVGKDIDIAAEYQKMIDYETNTGYIPSYSATEEQKAEMSAAFNSAWQLRYYPWYSGTFGAPGESSWGSSQFPTEGTIRVDFDETTKALTVTIKVKDYYVRGSMVAYSPITYKHDPATASGGTGRWIEISYEGTCVKYDGRGGSYGFDSYSHSDAMVWE